MTRDIVLVFALLLFCNSDAAPTMGERMTVSKMSAEDLDSSASGYVYNHEQGLPVYYLHYTNHGSERYYDAADPVHYPAEAAAPVAHGVSETTSLLLPYAVTGDALRSNHHQGTGNYGNEQSPEHAAAPESLPRAPYYADGKISPNEGDEEEEVAEKTVEEDHDDGEDGYGGDDDEDEEKEEEEEEEGHGDDGKIHGGSAGSVKEYGVYGGTGKSHGDGGSSFESGKGEKYNAEEYSESGEKGGKGYQKQEKFSKGESGSKDNAHHEGHYKNKGGHKKGHVNEAEKHGSHEEAEKGKEGSSYGHSSYHKKGQKTNGFHNVYHKDEYRKETDFYDDEHKKGDFDKYEEFDKGYKSEEGGFKKGGHHSSGHDYQDHGKKGHYDKGHHESQDQGHQDEKGEKSYYSNHEDYGAEEGSKSTKTYKFDKGDH